MKSFLFFLLSLASLCGWSPDYLIIGAQKGGTTALASFLSQHPLVLGPTKHVPRCGEIHYFDDNFDKGEKWYKKRFFEKPSPEYVAGDRSPYYLVHPLVPKRVHDCYPNIKLIVVLRNPVDRAYSHFWFNIRMRNETLSNFEDALAAEPSRLAEELTKFTQDPFYLSPTFRFFSYLTRSRYIEQIEEWLKYFSLNQIHIVDAADLRKHPQDTVNQVFSFLGLPPSDINIADPEKHKVYPPMNPETRKMLVEYFKPYNERLEILLNRKFNWK